MAPMLSNLPSPTSPSTLLIIVAGVGTTVLISAIVGALYYLRHRRIEERARLPMQNPPAIEDSSISTCSDESEIVVTPTLDAPPMVQKSSDMIVCDNYSQFTSTSMHHSSTAHPGTTTPSGKEACYLEHSLPCPQQTIASDNTHPQHDVLRTVRADNISNSLGVIDGSSEHRADGLNDSSIFNVRDSLELYIGGKNSIPKSHDFETTCTEVIESDEPLDTEQAYDGCELDSVNASKDCELRQNPAEPSSVDVQQEYDDYEAGTFEVPVEIETKSMRPSRSTTPDMTQFFEENAGAINAYGHARTIDFWENVKPELEAALDRELAQEAQKPAESFDNPANECDLDDGTDLDSDAFSTRVDLTESQTISFYTWVAAEPIHTVTIPPLRPKREESVREKTTTTPVIAMPDLIDYQPTSGDQTEFRGPTKKAGKSRSIFKPKDYLKFEPAKPGRPSLGVITNTFGLVTPLTGIKLKPSPPPSPTLLINGFPINDVHFGRGGIIEPLTEETAEQPSLLNTAWKPRKKEPMFKVTVSLKKRPHALPVGFDEEYDTSVGPLVIAADLDCTFEKFRADIDKHYGFPVILRAWLPLGRMRPSYIPIISDLYFRKWLEGQYKRGYRKLRMDAWRKITEY